MTWNKLTQIGADPTLGLDLRQMGNISAGPHMNPGDNLSTLAHQIRKGVMEMTWFQGAFSCKEMEGIGRWGGG